ncbi:MAG: PEP-CTERM sorting domain-containing protein [Gemmataceae bacterium]
MKHFLTAHVTALALVLVAGTGARAAIIPPDSIQWTYNFTPGAPAVLADGNPAAGVTFTNEPTKSAVGSSDIVATNLRVFSSTTAAAPDALVSNGAYSLAMTLTMTEGLTTYTQTLNFAGKLTGKFSAENANVANLFTSPGPVTVTLGSYNFTVSLIAYTPPGPPDQSNAGSISAHVSVSSLTPAGVPEPSTMLLSGLGLSFLGGAAWRKRRQARTAVAV